jgi:peroxiredoxin
MLKVKNVILGLVTIVTMSFLASGPALAQVASGQKAPDFTLTDTKGQKHSLSDYKGKFVVLEWFNPECPFVNKHYNSGNMPGLQKQYTSKGVIWLSIDSSAPGQQGNFPPQGLNQFIKEKSGSPTAIFEDTNGRIGHLYGAQTTPHMFVIDPNGTLIYQGAIDDIPSPDIDDLKTAKNYVSAALDAAMSGKPVAVNSTKSYGCSIKY